MKKLFKYIRYFLYFILLIFLILLHIAEFNDYKKLKSYENFTKSEEKYVNDIREATNDEVFPVFDTKIDTVTKENQEYLNKNFMNFNYDINHNKNVEFKMLLPIFFRDCDCIVFNNEDPFKYTNERTIVAVEAKNNKLDIFGEVHVYNTTLEVDNNAINNFYITNILESKLIKNKVNYFVNGFVNDALSANQSTGKVTRSIVVRRSSLYYIVSFTFKDFYHYMKYAKDVSAVFDSFHPKNFSNKLINIDLELTKIKNYDLLYPKGWNIESEYNKENNILKITTNPENYSAIINIYVLENTNKTNIELSEKYLDIIRQEDYVFDGIDTENAFYNEDTHSYIFFLKNPKIKDTNIPLTIYVKVEGTDSKKLVSILVTSRTKK